MTCALPVTPWHHFNDHLPWFPMANDLGLSPTLVDVKPFQGNVSPSSDTWKSSSNSGKRRMSRAGTRSVTTLTVAQLERKRANDREAQRAVRERTKTHIDNLQRSINDLRGSREACEQLFQITQQRNRELEEENAYLRRKLSEAAMSADLPPPDYQKSVKRRVMPVPSTSTALVAGMGPPRPDSKATPSAQISLAPSQHDLWQPQTEGLMGVVHTTAGLPSHPAIADAADVTTWRLQGLPTNLQVHAGSPQQQVQCVDWSGNDPAYQQCVGPGQQAPQHQHQTPSMQQRGLQPSTKALEVSAPPQQPSYHVQSNAQSDFSRHLGIIDFKQELHVPPKPAPYPTTINFPGDTNAGAMTRNEVRSDPAPCLSASYFPFSTQ